MSSALNVALVVIQLLETASNATLMIQKINALIAAARAEGRDITLEELAALKEDNQELTEEVLALLRG